MVKFTDDMEEIWKDVAGYEGLYQVSNMGNVFSIRRKKILAKRYDEKGYCSSFLCSNGSGCNFSNHRLVYENFVEKIPCDLEIDHINGVRDDNRLSNLRVVTHKENMNNPTTIKKMKSKVGELSPSFGRKLSEDAKNKIRAFLLSDKNPRRGSCLSEAHRMKISKAQIGKKLSEQTKLKISKAIVQYSLDNTFIKEWQSATVIQRELGFNKSNICNCCKGKFKYAYGFIWKYKN